ncbi:oocyte zinc finger protein XlCOF8.4 [Bombina bombina]|uniref:oocyte zinc finger protein XlCOF8.4 n=1 Tax=Bombina bombina TaxID=8345 RepID=UPI00235ABFFB|nr:oocyte zinc finger protein XlCOF8.4 [Bombina bombina]XP_053544663.1 oocyte zinc finger protein XlCOF8.4 [Bombina bombina]
MNKNKNKMIERILNHALEIIYLLTGEEYTVVKKSSPHSSTDSLTGEVPIKCDDVAVYFSMEEWEYIEGHKELYKDAMMGARQTSKTHGIPEQKSIGKHKDNDFIPISEDGKGDLCDSIKTVEIHSEICDDDVDTELILSVEQIEESDVESQMEDPVQEPQKNISSNFCDHLNVVKIHNEIVTNNNMQHVEICSVPCAGFCDQNLNVVKIHNEIVTNSNMQHVEICSVPCADTVSNGDSEDCEDDNYIQQVEINSDTCADVDDENSDFILIEEETDETDNNIQPLEIPTDFCASWPLGWNTQERYPLCFSSTHHVTENTSITQNFQGLNHLNANTQSCNLKTSFQLMASNSDLHEETNLTEHMYTYRENTRTEYTAIHINDTAKEQQFHKNVSVKKYNYIECEENVNAVSLKTNGQFSCIECQMSFTSYADLSTHRKIHKEVKVLPCPDCGKCYRWKSQLVRHRRMHTREKPFPCSQCGKCFTQKSHLAKHQNIHSGKKPFSCSECGKCFSQKMLFDAHQRVHRGEKPFLCNKCGKGFNQRSHFLRHRKIHRNP